MRRRGGQKTTSADTRSLRGKTAGEKVTGGKGCELMSLPLPINPEMAGEECFPALPKDPHSCHVTDHHNGRESVCQPYSSETV